MASFQEQYRKLNTAQRRAVEAIEGPVMVIAGPGTGKTEVLTLRIVNILKKTDTPPDAIVALTFTEAAAAEMRRRLTALVGGVGYYVSLSTFHGFCNRLIREYPEEFPEIISSTPATEVEQVTLVRGILDAHSFRRLKPFGDPYYFVSDILAAVRALKNEGYDPAGFKKLLAKGRRAFAAAPDKYHAKGRHRGKLKQEFERRRLGLEKNAELLKVYSRYQKKLRVARRYDFEDMILETVAAMTKNKNFLLQVQERCQYVLVDEHQDTNGAQNKVLELIAGFHENPNVFVVGDEKQAIFRFQGASLENFLYFKNKYPRAKLINLEESYRSTQSILDASQSVVDHNRATLKVPLRARGGGGRRGKPVVVRAFGTGEEEVEWVADDVAEKISGGSEPSEIGVLFRVNADAFGVAEALERRGIAYRIESDQNILEDADVGKILLLLETVHEFGNEEKLAEALHIDFLGLDPLDCYKIFASALSRRRNLYDLISNRAALAQAGVKEADAFVRLYEMLRAWKRRAENEPFLKFFERLARESGFTGHLVELPSSLEKIEKVNALFGEMKKIAGGRGDYRLARFIAHLRILREHGVLLRGTSRKIPGRVRLMTAHRAKGLEFDFVFIVGAVDGHWGNRRERAGFTLPFSATVPSSVVERNEDERRLFYMAMTRARHEVFISYPVRTADGRECVPSQFIGEIRPELKTEKSEADAKRRGGAPAWLTGTPRAPREAREDAKEFVRKLFQERGLSPTALNNYLACPWKYFYVNLVRIPKVQTRFQVFGTAVHAALKKFFDAKKEFLYGEKFSVNPDAAFLVAEFERSLEHSPVSPKDFVALRAKGRGVLRSYHARYAGEWNYHTLNEYRVAAEVPWRKDGGVMITGNLDKLELDEKAREAVVVDYKTKKPESRRWIEGGLRRGGTPSSGSCPGDYKRQLVFYKLLLDLHPLKKYRFREAVIDFVEPNDRGIFKKEPFAVGEEETKELAALISRVASEIYDLSFWDKRCERRECEYCALREMMARAGNPAEGRPER